VRDFTAPKPRNEPSNEHYQFWNKYWCTGEVTNAQNHVTRKEIPQYKCIVNNTTENISALTTLILPNTTQSNYLKFPTPECHACTIENNTLLTVLFVRRVHSDCFHRVQKVHIIWQHGDKGPWRPQLTKEGYVNTLGTGYLNCLYAYKRKSASPVLNVLSGSNISPWSQKGKLIGKDLWWLLHIKWLYPIKSKNIKSSPILRAIGWFLVNLNFINFVFNKLCES
jgi:hypothetical protein